ncbi:MAG: Ig-like domain-containing protein [Oligoflexia bacterium]|nr:Ig-like domain-containing protein [Oligoflexia bacterium]
MTITLKDAYGNPVPGQTVAFSATGSGNTLTQPASVTNASGQAVGGIASTVAETKTLAISTPSGFTSDTTTVTFIASSVSVANSTITGTGPVTANGSSTSTITITLEDVNSNPVSGITPSFAASGSGNSYGACSATNASGVSTCTMSSTIAQTETLSITGPISKSGGSVSFVPGPASQLVWTTTPSGGTAGTAWGTQGVITIEDAQGNTVTTGADASASITLTLASGTGTLLGTTSVNAVSGVANFSGQGLKMNVSGGKTLLATKADTSGSGGTASSTATSSTFTITAAAASTLVVSGYPSPTTAGTSASITITAQDTFGNTATGYTGTVAFTSTDTAATLPSSYTFTTGDAGAHAFSGVTLKTQGSMLSITATDTVTGSITGTQSPIIVQSATADHLALIAGNSQNATVGTSVGTQPKAQVQDIYNNPVSGTTLTFTPSSGASVGSGTGTSDGSGYAATSFTVGTVSGSYTLTVARQTTALPGTPATLTFTETAIPGPAQTLSLTGYPSSTNAGTANSFTVTALDQYSNVATAYSGTVQFSSTDVNAALPTNATLTSGTGSFSGTFKTVGTQTLSATDTVTGSITGSESGIVVSPAGASTLVLSGFPSSVNAGSSNSITVLVKDLYGNTVTGYMGTIAFTSSDASATLPLNYTFTGSGGDAGTHTFSGLILATAGTQSITATDTVTSSIAGTESGITVIPTVSFSVATQDIAINQGTATVTVSLNSPATGSISIPISVNGSSTAVNNTDYTYTASPVAFSSGQSSQTISIPILDQLSPATPNATIVLNMGTPTGPVALGSTTSQTLTIREPSLDLNFATMIYPTQSSLASAGITFTRASTATYMDCDGLIKTAAVNQPRIDCNPTTGQPNGLLIEQHSTNVVLPSVMASGSGVSGEVTTADSAWAPDGTYTGALLNQTTTANGYTGTGATIANDSSSWTCSVYLKQGSAAQTLIITNLYNGTGINQGANITWSNHSLSGCTAGTNCSLTNAGNGWYRLSATIANNSSGNTHAACQLYPSGFNSTTGTVYAWGAQLENFAFPTSYIPTATASVTRSGDSAVVSNISWYTQGTGTLYVPFTHSAGWSTSSWPWVAAFDDTTSNNRSGFFINDPGAHTISFVTRSGGTNYGYLSPGTVGLGQINGTAATFTTNNLAATLNGSSLSTSNSAAIGNATRLVLGGGDYTLNGALTRTTYYNQLLSGNTVTSFSNTSNYFRTYQPTANLTLTSQAVIDPQGTVYVTAALSEPATTAITVPYTVGGTAVSGTNYAGLSNGNFVFAAGNSRATLSFTLIDDGSSTNPTITVTLGSGTGYTVGTNSSQTITIQRPALDLNFAAMYNPASQISQAPYNSITFARSSTGSYMDATGLINYAAANVPRIDHNPTTHQPNGLLVEELRENYLLNSSNLTAASWTATGGTLTYPGVMAPDGTSSATLLTENTSNSAHKVCQTVSSVTDAQTWSTSFYILPNGRSQFVIYLADAGATANTVYAVVTLTGSGTLNAFNNGGNGTGVSNSTVFFTQLQSGWYRVGFSGKPDTSGTSLIACAQLASGGSGSYLGNGASGAYVWGAQLEVGAFPTSYIPTTTAAVTRQADDVSSTSFSWFNYTSGSFYTEGIAEYPTSTSGKYPMWFDMYTSSSNRFELVSQSASANVYWETAYSGTVKNFSSGTFSSSAETPIAVEYNTADFTSTNSGVLTGTSTALTIPSSLSTFYIGSQAGGNYFNGAIDRLTYYPVRLSNQQLQMLSNPNQYSPRVYTPSVTLTQSSQSVMQSDGQAFFVASLSQPAMSTITVPYTISGTAVSGTDYSGLSSSGTLTFTAGQSIALAQFTVNTTSSNNLTVIMTLGSPTGATLGTNTSETIYLANISTGLALTTSSVINNGSTVTYSGTCAPGLTITISGAQSSSTTCSNSGTWSWTSSTVSTDGNYTFNFTQSDGINTSSTSSGTYDRDTTAPNAVGTFADGNYTTSLTQSPLMTWNATTDSGSGASGIAYYMLAIGSTAGGTDIVNWTNVGNVTFYQVTGLSLTDGNMYYGSIKAVDNAGNVSSVTQGDGFAVVTDTPTLNLNFMQSSLSNQNTSYPTVVQFTNTAGSGISAPMYYNSSGTLTAAAENFVRNNTMVGGSAPSTVPTHWSIGCSGGPSASYAYGTEDGISYIDIAYSGTFTVNGYCWIIPESSTYIAASVGQSWTMSWYTRISNGTAPAGYQALISATKSGGTGASDVTNAWNSPTSSALATQRSTLSGTISDATTAYVYPHFVYYYNSGQTLNYTLRMGLPQLELGSSASQPIATSGSPAYGPRFDYDPYSVGSLKGLLIEESRTNSLLYSAAVGGTSWSLSDETITSNALTAPDGTSTATLITEGTDGSSSHHDVYQDATATVAQTWTLSFYAHASSRSQLEFFIYNKANTGSGVGGRFNLTSTGSTFALSNFGNGSGATASIQALSNGWYRCTLSGQPDTSGTSVRALLRIVSGGSDFYQGTGVAAVYVWGAQLEQGAMMTSYIPTTTTAMTRSADIATIPSLGSWFNASAGTVVSAGIFPTWASPNANRMFMFDDGTTSNGIGIFLGSTTSMTAQIKSGGTQQFTPNLTASLGSVMTGAIGYQTNNVAGAVQGAISTSSSATIPNDLTELWIGSISGPGYFMDGWLQAVNYYNTQLTNGAVQELTHP